MVELSSILPGLDALWAKTLGSSAITLAVLDGPVDQAHACFAGAALEHLTTLIQDEARPQGAMSTHGTHVASVIFGQPGSAVRGLAPRCSGLLAPVFADDRQRLSQLDLARAIEQAVQAGAQVINVSGGQLTDFGETEDLLERAVRLCQESNSLLVAAAGNDGCACLHTPAALPAVLAVGTMDAQGQPLESSNWGEAYQTQGVLAPGDGVVGAKPGGGTVKLSGTSFATPIVSGVAALLLSLQHQRGEIPDPRQVRATILSSALACEAAGDNRCLVGKLNIPGAYQQLLGEPLMSEQQVEHVEAIPEAVEPACGCENPVASNAVAALEPQWAARGRRQRRSLPGSRSHRRVQRPQGSLPRVRLVALT